MPFLHLIFIALHRVFLTKFSLSLCPSCLWIPPHSLHDRFKLPVQAKWWKVNAWSQGKLYGKRYKSFCSGSRHHPAGSDRMLGWADHYILPHSRGSLLKLKLSELYISWFIIFNIPPKVRIGTQSDGLKFLDSRHQHVGGSSYVGIAEPPFPCPNEYVHYVILFSFRRFSSNKETNR